MSLLNLISTLLGTESVHSFSNGNTLPITAMPFGMNHWSPQTNGDFRWWFRAGDRKLHGIRCTHQPSPWIADYAPLLFMPTTGERLLRQDQWAGAYRPERSTFKPHRFETEIIRYRAKLSLVPTLRGAVLKIEFPKDELARLILFCDPGERGMHRPATIHIDADAGMITGHTNVFHHGAPADFAMHFAISLSKPFKRFGTFDGIDRPADHENVADVNGIAAGAYVEWDGVDGPVEARIATSFISLDQARLNLAREVVGTFEDLGKKAASRWDQELGQIELDGLDDERRATFYTCFYRTKLFPRVAYEFDADDTQVHYSPFDGRVHDGPLYTDNGFWDTYRTHFPLLCLLDPGRVGEMMEGYLNAYREGGWLPQWASPGYRDCMIGTHSDAVVADAILRGIEGFDHRWAYEAIKQNGTAPSDQASYGRKGLADLRRLGFLTTDHYHGTCATLDFAYDDFCIGQVAAELGHDADAKTFREYAQTYRNVFDADTGFFRGKNADGSWKEPFEPFDWGGPYVEGGAWQHAFDVPHDPAGLIALHGGDEKLVAKLDEMLATPPYFNIGDYGGEIHEMTEMAAVDFGQYAHSNQPVHHVLMMYAAAGAPEKMRYWVRKVMNELYDASPTGLCGDEDNGEMCAWYVLNAIGLFPLCPGVPEWVLTSPIAAKAIVTPAGRKPFTIIADGTSKDACHVHSVSIDGRPHEKLTVGHATLVAGATVKFTMGQDAPPRRHWPADARPKSVSAYR